MDQRPKISKQNSEETKNNTVSTYGNENIQQFANSCNCFILPVVFLYL